MKMLSACLLLLPFISCTQVQDTKNDAVIEQKIEALLSRMTLEEKIGQMNQISSYGNIEDMSGLIKKGEVGSILNEVDPVRVNALQRVAMEESRLGIPLLMARDVIHGFKTIFPIPLGQAASFNPQVAKDGARVAAVEASAVGIRWTFAPMIDVARDPRWGRMAEGCGEDTYLTSVMGVAMVEGFQGDSLNSPTSIAACPKHFVGYGAAEGGRDYNSTFIPERRLRDVYLPPFEAVAKAGAATFMTSFNDNDGAPSTGNTFILKDVLRGEWGFDGIVVSDWASVAEMMAHGFAADSKEAAMKAVNAGVDMEMVSYTFVKELPELIKEGKVKKSAIDDAVRNILRIKFRLGLFDNPYVDEKRIEELYAPSHLEAAKQAAVESAILLKNEKETLPLQSSVKTVAVVGPMANAPYDQLGTWIFDGDKTKTVTPLKAIKELVGDKVQVIYEPGLTYSRDKNMAGVAKAAAAAARADVILAFVGEEAILSGEAHCLADLNLQGAQSELIAALAKTGKPVVTVVMAGRPLTIGKEVELSSAVLYSFHPGTMGGPALIKEGKVKKSAIDDAVRNILRIKFRLGLFDNPYVDEKRIEELYAPSHLEAAKQAAVESAILLKNEKETLPLQSSVKTVAVVGPMANAPYDQLGTWIFDGDKTKTVTPLKAIKELVGDKVQVIYEPGLTYSRDKNMAGVAKAAAAAARADVILAFVGEEAILSGEAHCLADLNLQGAQSELIAALAKTGKPVVTVVMAGRPLTIGKEVELSSAVLYSFHPGTMGGPALADLLWGKAVPSGKTPVTFPKMVGQIPVYYAHNSSGRPATRNEVLLNDIPLEAGQTSLGCTSFYMDAGFDPLYPFGYGLSYTTFKYDNVKLSSANLKKEDVLTVTFDLENTGKYEGTEVAQLYVQDKFASVTRPVKELKRFARVTLKPGEKKNVSFELPISELAFWNIDMVKTVEAGDFALWVAPDSQSGEEVFFKVVD